LANRSHKVIFDANDRFIGEADVRIKIARVRNAHKVIVNNSKGYDRFGGLVVCQDEVVQRLMNTKNSSKIH
jgi:hypothetical protein